MLFIPSYVLIVAVFLTLQKPRCYSQGSFSTTATKSAIETSQSVNNLSRTSQSTTTEAATTQNVTTITIIASNVTTQNKTTSISTTQSDIIQATTSQSVTIQNRATRSDTIQATNSQSLTSQATITQTATAQTLIWQTETTPTSSTQSASTQSVTRQSVTIQSTSSRSVITQPMTTQFPSSTTTLVTTPRAAEDSSKVLIVLAVFLVLAAIAAGVFIILYLRSSYACYQVLGSRFSRAEVVTLQHIDEPQLSSPRERLSSFSSFRIKHNICKSDPLSIKAYHSHVKRLHRDSDYLFSQEYETIGGKKYLSESDRKVELTHEEGQKEGNQGKNRYGDILPYDHNRVVLTELDDDPHSSYINASYVDSYRNGRAYIAAQGPLPSTLCDFWRMVWESNTRVVVMITNLFERSRPKCVKYWPDDGYADYGLIRVTFVKEESFANFVVRSFSMQPVPDQTHYISIDGETEVREIKQFHYTEWPDHDVPVHPAAILTFIRKSKAASPAGAGPIIVHCSAGVGRSGTYIVIDSMMERIDDDKTVDIFNFLNHIRTQRIYLVQEESQYIFVHDAVLEYTDFGDSDIPVEDFQAFYQSLLTLNPDAKKTGLKKEFEDVDHTKVLEKHKWAAKKACNTLKNRRKDVLPIERNRVKLPPVLGVDGGDYINASYIDGFSKKREYIATQAPMGTTTECFWRMVCSTDCKMIVMLLSDDEWKKDDYFGDLPTADEAVTCGKFEINLESEEVLEHVTVRELRLFASNTSYGRTVRHYHYRDWPAKGFPEDKNSIITFIEKVRNDKIAQAGKAPVIVHCDFGVGRTGIFCLVSTLLDQIERERCLDVYQTAKLYRLQRSKFIETEEQYSFCYDLLNHVVSTKLHTFGEKSKGNPELISPDSSSTTNHKTRSDDTPDVESNDDKFEDTPAIETPESPLIKSPSASGIDNPEYRHSNDANPSINSNGRLVETLNNSTGDLATNSAC